MSGSVSGSEPASKGLHCSRALTNCSGEEKASQGSGRDYRLSQRELIVFQPLKADPSARRCSDLFRRYFDESLWVCVHVCVCVVRCLGVLAIVGVQHCEAHCVSHGGWDMSALVSDAVRSFSSQMCSS